MCLIDTKTHNCEEFEGDNVPSYAILSHRWETEEVLYQDMQLEQQRPAKKRFKELSFACGVAA